jgi:hypothetical protein
MNKLVATIMGDLSRLTAKDLDECSVEELCQFKYFLNKWQGSIFVKTVGRLSQQVDLKCKQN